MVMFLPPACHIGKVRDEKLIINKIRGVTYHFRYNYGGIRVKLAIIIEGVSSNPMNSPGCTSDTLYLFSTTFSPMRMLTVTQAGVLASNRAPLSRATYD